MVFKFRLRELDIVRNVRYKRGQRSNVIAMAATVRKRLEHTLAAKGRCGALQLWETTEAERLARSGGSPAKGGNLTRALRRRGGITRSRFLRNNPSFQQAAQRKMIDSRRKRSRKGQSESAVSKAVAAADENELKLLETYLQKRHDSKR